MYTQANKCSHAHNHASMHALSCSHTHKYDCESLQREREREREREGEREDSEAQHRRTARRNSSNESAPRPFLSMAAKCFLHSSTVCHLKSILSKIVGYHRRVFSIMQKHVCLATGLMRAEEQAIQRLDYRVPCSCLDLRLQLIYFLRCILFLGGDPSSTTKRGK
jgi:hypothetical protein